MIAEAGTDPVTGERRQTRKRYRTEKEARDALAGVNHAVAQGTYVARSAVTVEQACAEWLAGKRVGKSTRAAYTHALQPVRDRFGTMPIQQLSKADLDNLVTDLQDGEFYYAHGRACQPWAAATINPMLRLTGNVLESQRAQGYLTRNVAALVDRVPNDRREMDTYTPNEVRKVIAAADKHRIGHAWHLALSGLRRGEIAGLRWSDVDLIKGTLTVVNTRIQVDGEIIEKETKTAKSRRTLPLTPVITEALKRASVRQAAERLALGEDYGAGAYVVCDEAGEPLHPDKLSRGWHVVCTAAGVRPIRLHDARHTCGTLMHLQGVPIATVSAWLGHCDAAFTLRTYVHNQADALTAAAQTLNAVVTGRDTAPSVRTVRTRSTRRKSTG
ncbi:tyrosine-type recombinase/integrase [Nocardia abscessus]|uniref:tyrosine-type recombinase/integrase n=1 Tax=Nocardia abscessus TaxID=120957 RepID=UPI002456C3E9|nr:tyrosine-type recombinase/integrase [Nocardia abscessus]